jgi:hypothetical protein
MHRRHDDAIADDHCSDFSLLQQELQFAPLGSGRLISGDMAGSFINGP